MCDDVTEEENAGWIEQKLSRRELVLGLGAAAVLPGCASDGAAHRTEEPASSATSSTGAEASNSAASSNRPGGSAEITLASTTMPSSSMRISRTTRPLTS